MDYLGVCKKPPNSINLIFKDYREIINLLPIFYAIQLVIKVGNKVGKKKKQIEIKLSKK